MRHVKTKVRRFPVVESAGTILSGAGRGQQLLAKLLAVLAPETAVPDVLFLDFDGVESATASFLRESILAFRDIARNRRSNIYPVVANASLLVQEDLVELVQSRGGVMVLCQLDACDRVKQPRVIGTLDPKQQLTFDLVKKLGSTDAAALREHSGDNSVVPTVWNNRLASLVGLGLLVEESSSGRTKRYRMLLEGI